MLEVESVVVRSTVVSAALHRLKRDVFTIVTIVTIETIHTPITDAPCDLVCIDIQWLL